MKLKELHTPLCILSIAMIGIIGILIRKYHDKTWALLIGIMLMGGIYFLQHPLHTQLPIILGENQKIIASIETITHSDYGTIYTLEKVSGIQNQETVSIQFKLQGYSKGYAHYEVGNRLLIEGTIEQLPIQYNPSDMDYGLYLKGKGIGAVIQIDEMKLLESDSNLINRWVHRIKEHIGVIFQDKDQGMINGLILGDKAELNSELKELYNKLGIGHVLAISGLHVGIVYGILWWVTGKFKLNYTIRNIIIAIMLWLYCMLSGFSISAIRATALMTLLIVAKLLWEELDLWIGISFVSLGMVIIQPYIIYQVGYQLSFMAYISLILWSEIIKCMKYTYRMNKRTLSHIQILGSSLWISLWISPILAYHFYEIPIVASLMNLLILGFMELLIPIILLTLILGYIHLNLSIELAGGICLALDLVAWIGEKVVQLPLATKVIGRPDLGNIVLYYAGLIMITWIILHNIDYKSKEYIFVFIVGAAILLNTKESNHLEITQLYVGQGDAAVMITPQKQVVVIDGGAKGKGNIIKQFIYYNGKDTVDLAIVSHPHEDHIAGIVELIEQDVTVKAVMMPFVVDNEWAERLKQLCHEKQIPLYKIEQGDKIELNEVKITCLSPDSNVIDEDLNVLSAVLFVQYRAFDALYTGDLPIEQEFELLSYIGDLDVLKVGHHGSSTSTSEKLLQHTLPEYGMISCSENNRYNHPHPIVIERLEAYSVEILKTYEQGAIMLNTDGMNLSIETHIGG